MNLSKYENCVNSGIRGQPPVRSHDKHDESMTLKGVEEGKRYYSASRSEFCSYWSQLNQKSKVMTQIT